MADLEAGRGASAAAVVPEAHVEFDVDDHERTPRDDQGAAGPPSKIGSFWTAGGRSFMSNASGAARFMFGRQGGSAGDLRVKGKASIQAERKQRKLSFRGKGRRFLLSIEFQTFMTVVILADIAAFVVEELTQAGDDEEWPVFVNITTLALYTLEIVFKLICFGLHGFVRDKWNIFDTLIVLVSAVLFSGPGGILVAARLTKLVFRVLKAVAKSARLCLRLKPMSQAAQARVSKNKFRYVDIENNLDLDLTYIDKDLVAMGVPTVGFFNTFVRNSLYEVARFFKIFHQGHFRVYNACPEMPYPDAPFEKAGGSMVCLQIQDHSPPRMEQFLTFLGDCREFKGLHHDNVIAVHCKAGKGRTGSLCVAWLLYTKRQKTAEAALAKFAEMRTDTRIGRKLRGVETPSQVRYVNQLFQHLKRTDSWQHSPEPPPPIPTPTATLHRLCIEGEFLAHPEEVARGVRVLVQCFESASNLAEPVLETETFAPAKGSVSLRDVVVKGDVRVALFADKGKNFSAREAMLAAPKNFNKAKGLLAYFCFHTGFLYEEDEAPSCSGSALEGEFKVDVSEMDKASKRIKTEKKDGRFLEGSQLVLHFSGGYVPPTGTNSCAVEANSPTLLSNAHRGRSSSSYVSTGSSCNIVKDGTSCSAMVTDKISYPAGHSESGRSGQLRGASGVEGVQRGVTGSRSTPRAAFEQPEASHGDVSHMVPSTGTQMKSPRSCLKSPR